MLAAVIMAGGRGERFWPQSRENNPKQCLRIISDRSMIEETVKRLEPLIPQRKVFISTGKQLYEHIERIVPDVNFVLEPMARNTAACIGLSAISIMEKDPAAIMFIETTDHIYKDIKAYLEHIKRAVGIAEKGKICLIGIKPTHPHTGLGYIHYGKLLEEGKIKVYEITEFKEKPDLETAKKFLQGGNYLWNSGMFICKCSVMLDAMREFMPNLYNGLIKIKESDFDEKVKEEVFEQLESVSIDYGVMEKAKGLAVIKAEMHWDDVGDWAAMDRIHDKDKNGNVIKANWKGSAKNSIIFGDEERRIITENVDNIIIVDTEDSLLVCKKERAQDLKKLVQQLENDDELKEYTIQDLVTKKTDRTIAMDSTNVNIKNDRLVAVLGVNNLSIEKIKNKVIVRGTG